MSIRNLCSYLLQHGYDVSIFFFTEYEQIIANIEKLLESDIVGISFVTDELHESIILSDEIRKRRDGLHPLIIFGGVHPTINPDQCLEYCDYVIRGEGEETLLEICNNKSEISRIENISYKKTIKLYTTLLGV